MREDDGVTCTSIYVASYHAIPLKNGKKNPLNFASYMLLFFEYAS
jgi:hypothetical protein